MTKRLFENGNGSEPEKPNEPAVVEVEDDGAAEDTIIEEAIGEVPNDFARLMAEAAERAQRAEDVRRRPAIELLMEAVTPEKVNKALDGKKLIGYAVFLVDEDGKGVSALLIPPDQERAEKVVTSLITGLETRKFGLIHEHS